MYFIANSLCDIDMKHILIGKTYNTPTREITNLYIKENGKSKELMLCTENLHIPWNKTYTNDELSFNIEFCNNNNNFIEELDSLCNKIIKRVCKKRNLTNIERGNDHFKDYPNTSKGIRFFNVKINDISVYDENGVCLNISNISKSDVVKCLFHMKACWFRDGKVGVDMYIVQILRKSPYNYLNQKHMLLKDSSIRFSKEDEEIYNKYAKMLHVGVPLNSVQNAFNMDQSINESSKKSIAEKLGFTSVVSPVSQVNSKPPPPPPPPLPTKKQLSMSKASNPPTSIITKTNNVHEQTVQSKSSTNNPSLSSMITINDLQNAIIKLKKKSKQNNNNISEN